MERTNFTIKQQIKNGIIISEEYIDDNDETITSYNSQNSPHIKYKPSSIPFFADQWYMDKMLHIQKNNIPDYKDCTTSQKIYYFSVKLLKEIARQNNIPYAYKMKRKELIRVLTKFYDKHGIL